MCWNMLKSSEFKALKSQTLSTGSTYAFHCLPKGEDPNSVCVHVCVFQNFHYKISLHVKIENCKIVFSKMFSMSCFSNLCEYEHIPSHHYFYVTFMSQIPFCIPPSLLHSWEISELHLTEITCESQCVPSCGVLLNDFWL